jgi:hypothetical protein
MKGSTMQVYLKLVEQSRVCVSHNIFSEPACKKICPFASQSFSLYNYVQ